MDGHSGNVTPSAEDGGGGIPLRSLVRNRGPSGGSESNHNHFNSSMNRKTSRNNLLSAGNSRIRKVSSRSKLKDSDEEASQSLLGSGHGGVARLTDGRATLIGEGEQEGEYDSLWKDQNDEEQSLLEEGRMLVRCLLHTLRLCSWTGADALYFRQFT